MLVLKKVLSVCFGGWLVVAGGAARVCQWLVCELVKVFWKSFFVCPLRRTKERGGKKRILKRCARGKLSFF
jgi:hypothetical protein